MKRAALLPGLAALCLATPASADIAELLDAEIRFQREMVRLRAAGNCEGALRAAFAWRKVIIANFGKLGEGSLPEMDSLLAEDTQELVAMVTMLDGIENRIILMRRDCPELAEQPEQ
jgi:hypothetical protein